MKSVVFIAILFAALLCLIRIMVPKNYYNATWTDSSSCANFYALEKNTIDVLFLGSSHCMSSFSPQEIYDSHGLRTYNLATQQQSLLVSYFWLKEALRYQHPSVVVLDTHICFPFDSEEPLNSSEAAVRLAMDSMRWSKVKVEAVAEICKNDDMQSAASYYNPLIRFHTRWINLKEDDFTFFELSGHNEMKGYVLLSDYYGRENYQPFKTGSSDTMTEMVPLMEEYLDKIVELCMENKIQLVLVKTPSATATIERYNCMTAYAQEHQIEYYDFNEISLYSEIDYQFSTDNHDSGHVNYWGAKKISTKIAEILTDNRYQVQAVQDVQWETSRDFYATAVENAQLRHITDIVEYLETIRRDRYTIFMAVKGDASNFLTENSVQQLHQLGLRVDLLEANGNSYYAVISSEEILEEIGTQKLSAQGAFRDGRCTYSISSAGYECGNSCSIQINNTEYAKRQSGLNVVVYDNVYRKVVDSVCFDTYSESLNAKRSHSNG